MNVNLICIYIESNEVKINKDCIDLITIANKFKREYGFKTCGIAICNTGDSEALRASLADLELDEVYIKHGVGICYYDEQVYTDALDKFCRKHKPLLVLGCNTVHSKAVLARFSYRSGVGMCADCVEFWFEDDKVFTTRPIYNGAMFANICTQRNQCMVCTVRKNLFEYKKELDIKPTIHVESLNFISQSELLEIGILDTLVETKECSKIMIGIGNGIGNKDNVRRVMQIAKKLSADIGATRLVVENGWLPKSSQIGLSGKILKNIDLYLALGISGAYQHLCGVLTCKKIVAVNNDKNCEMFKYSDIGIVGDVEDALVTLEKTFCDL